MSLFWASPARRRRRRRLPPDMGGLKTPEASNNAGLLAGTLAAVATGVVALGGGALGAAWYARRRVIR